MAACTAHELLVQLGDNSQLLVQQVEHLLLKKKKKRGYRVCSSGYAATNTS
jgi:hypothetical protein